MRLLFCMITDLAGDISAETPIHNINAFDS